MQSPSTTSPPSPPPQLRLDWCNLEAVAFACRRWHYSRSVPIGKLVKVGVWEDSVFVGVVVFGMGANRHIGCPFDMVQTEACELVRIALREHATPVSRIVAIALLFLRRHCPGLRIIVSYADTAQGHHGGIYQAGGWIYSGPVRTPLVMLDGKPRHQKSLHAKYGDNANRLPWIREHLDPDAVRVFGVKHVYLMPLDAQTRARILPLAQPYPKRHELPVAAA